MRESYRAKREQAGAAVRDDDCRVNIPRLPDIATRRTVFINGEAVEMLTLTATEMGEALLRNTQVVYRWINAMTFPAPVLGAVNKTKRVQLVYSLDEAEALLRVMGEHQSHTQYYREIHTETCAKAFAAVAEIRQNRGKTEHGDRSITHAAAA